MKLKSTLFRHKYQYEIDNKNEDNNLSDPILVFSGLGAGHGVGMSQWGAKYMARMGYKSNQILRHYYEGVQIKPFKNIYK